MRYLIGILLLLLLVLHQDNWFWEDDTLVFGFIPMGLFYHACISVAASITWFLATKFVLAGCAEWRRRSVAAGFQHMTQLIIIVCYLGFAAFIGPGGEPLVPWHQ